MRFTTKLTVRSRGPPHTGFSATQTGSNPRCSLGSSWIPWILVSQHVIRPFAARFDNASSSPATAIDTAAKAANTAQPKALMP